VIIKNNWLNNWVYRDLIKFDGNWRIDKLSVVFDLLVQVLFEALLNLLHKCILRMVMVIEWKMECLFRNGFSLEWKKSLFDLKFHILESLRDLTFLRFQHFSWIFCLVIQLWDIDNLFKPHRNWSMLELLEILFSPLFQDIIILFIVVKIVIKYFILLQFDIIEDLQTLLNLFFNISVDSPLFPLNMLLSSLNIFQLVRYCLLNQLWKIWWNLGWESLLLFQAYPIQLKIVMRMIKWIWLLLLTSRLFLLEIFTGRRSLRLRHNLSHSPGIQTNRGANKIWSDQI
jgi:hypothetical protein